MVLVDFLSGELYEASSEFISRIIDFGNFCFNRRFQFLLKNIFLHNFKLYLNANSII